VTRFFYILAPIIYLELVKLDTSTRLIYVRECYDDSIRRNLTKPRKNTIRDLHCMQLPSCVKAHSEAR